MILDVLAFRNKKLKCYTQPFFSQEKEENIEQNMARALFTGGESMILKYKNLVLYKFGTFDDNAGKYDLLDEPVMLFDCDDIIASIPEV